VTEAVPFGVRRHNWADLCSTRDRSRIADSRTELARGVLARVPLALSPCVLVVPWNGRPLWGGIPAAINSTGGW
jgi:hypothetical protein